MKNRLLYNSLIGVVLLCLMAVPVSAQSRKAERAARRDSLENVVREIVESGTFTIEIDHSNPMQGASRNLFPSYKMKIDGDKVTTYLPYFGRSYTAPADPRNLAVELTDYQTNIKQKTNNKKGYTFTFDATTTGNETYNFTVTISAGGSSGISLISSNRQGITYSGKLITTNK